MLELVALKAKSNKQVNSRAPPSSKLNIISYTIKDIAVLNILRYNLRSDTTDNIALPCQQRFLSMTCMAFTVYEVVHVAFLLRSRQMTQ